jgi:regulatory protein YycH of two-component signal transduction system YycFG
LLDGPEYKENAKISITTAERNGETVPVGIHFENKDGDFKNDYRFMNTEVINEKMKTVKFRGVKWDVELEPTVAAVTTF